MGRESRNIITENLGSNSNKIAFFVKWYVDSKDKSEEDYNNVCKCCSIVEYSHAMSEWLLREDVQEAIKEYLKAQRSIKMLNIFNAMYDKAVSLGDVNSAKWCETFFKSEFFESETDEADDYLEGINIPSLSGGKNGNK